MKTTLDLPRPLLLRIVARAARKRIPLSRYVAESLERAIPIERPPRTDHSSTEDHSLFDDLRGELGL
jgi:hypothetical protein